MVCFDPRGLDRMAGHRWDGLASRKGRTGDLDATSEHLCHMAC
jgi:hypothetical protein